MNLLRKREVLLKILFPLKGLLDSEKCNDLLFAEFHPEGAVCPHCQRPFQDRCAKTFQRGGRVKCFGVSGCGRMSNIWTGTLLHGSHMRPEEFVLMRLAVAAGLDATGIMELLGRHGQFVALWSKRIRSSAPFLEIPHE